MSALATNSDKPHPIGGRRGAWPGFKTRAWPQCRWAAARPGWASPSDTSAAGLEGTGVPEGTCRGTGGRRRSLAGLVQATQVLPVWRAPECPKGPAAAPVGGGGARTTHRQQAPPDWRPPRSLARLQDTGLAAVPVGGGGAWPDNESTRRAKLAARTARGRAAGHRHTQQPGPTAPGTPAAPQAPSNGEASELLVVLRVLVGLAAVGSPERANRSHLFRRQREREDVEVLALALGVTGLGQGQSTELVVPA